VGPRRLRSARTVPRGPGPTRNHPVIQLALLLALSLIGFVVSFAFGRLEVRRSPVSSTVKRAEGALERASLLLLRLGTARAAPLLLVPTVGLVAFSLLGGGSATLSSAGRAVFLVLALLAGAASTLVQARLALGLGARAASSATAAVARGSALAMRPLLRGSVAIAVFGDALGVLGIATTFGLLYAIRGGFAAALPNLALAAEGAALLPAFALGAAVSALVLTREGSVAASSADLGGAPGPELADAAAAGDARDPALLARLVGQLVGELLPRALTSYVCGLTITVATAKLASAPTFLGATTASCLVLVALVRAFGGLASICGVLAARVSEEEPPQRGLGRGLVSAGVVATFGLGAALFWLERPHFLPLFGASLLGLGSMTVVTQLAWLPLRRSATPREVADTRQTGEVAAILRGAGSGVSAWWPALVLPALALALAERTLSGAAPSGTVTVAFVAGALSLGPFALSLSGFGLLSTHTQGVAALSRLELEHPRRLTKLDDASAWSRLAGSMQGSLGLSLSTLLGLLSLAAVPHGETSLGLGLGALSLGFGLCLVLVFGARATRSAVQGARLVALEVERQLRDVPPRQGVSSLPSDYTPSYKACVDAAFEAARGAPVVELFGLLMAPFLLGALLHGAGAAGIGQALASFGLAAVLTGLILTLGGRATRATLRELRRRLRSSDLAPAATTGVQAQSFGDLVGVTTAASVEALALVLALTVLSLAPLLR
jgi:Na+/H+-translocating membrane pyrophosphatase